MTKIVRIECNFCPNYSTQRCMKCEKLICNNHLSDRYSDIHAGDIICIKCEEELK